MSLRTSIKRKTIAVIMLTSTIALTVTIAAFLIYDLIAFRQTMVRNLQTQGQIVAGNSSAAVAFKSENDARDILAALRAEPHIVRAALYDEKGNLFVKYPPEVSIADHLVEPSPASQTRFERKRLTLYEPVTQSGSRLGTLYLESDLRAISSRLKLYAAVSILIMLGSLFVALWLSNALQRRLTMPIVALAETARNITGKKSFSVRARKSSDDELGDLTDAFNAMLDQIQTSHLDLEKSRAQLQIITDYASVLLCHVDRREIYLFVNPAYSARFNLTPSQVVGRSIVDLVGPLAYEAFRHQVARTLAGERVEFEMEIPYEKQGLRWMHCIYVPERNGAGEVIGFVGIISDITARKHSEQEVERVRDEAVRASRAKDDFLAALSHELRTPLSPVLLLASEAAANADLPPAVRDIFETISKNVSLEARLIDDLLDLTSITRNKLLLDMQPTDAHAQLTSALSTIQADIDSKKIALTLDLAAGAPMVFGDPVRLQQIFWNVLKNAVKFTPISGNIRIVTRTRHDQLSIAITDTGIGLTSDEAKRVFNAFSQGDHAVRTGPHRFGGLGLGLAISHRLVELHSGKLFATSPGRDQGSTFIIELPLISAAQTAPVKNSSPAPPVAPAYAPGLRILLVEDHEPTRIALAHLLTRRHWIVAAAATVAEARKLAASEKIDFVLSDIGLPDGNGYTLMAELRDAYGLKGIALTGYGMEEDVARSNDAGFVAHLIKPVHVYALERALTAALGSPPKT